MSTITMRILQIAGSLRLGATKRGVTDFSKLHFFDVRLMGAIAAALIALASLSNLEPQKTLLRPEVARGEPGVLVMSHALSPASVQIATTDDAGHVSLRDAATGWQIKRFHDFPGHANSVAFSPDGRILAIVGRAPGICLWDLSSGTSQQVATDVALSHRAERVGFSPDGQTLAVTTDIDGKVFLWDLATRRESMVFHHPSTVMSIAFSPDGRWLAAGGNRDPSILIWDVHTGSRRESLMGETGGHTVALAFSPDGTLLASVAFPQGHVRLWDLKSSRVCRTIEGERRSFINSVAFSPDGSLLATAGNDGMIGLWTVSTGQRRVNLDSQALWCQSVAFSPDGRTLILGTGTDGIRWWDIGELLRASPVSSTSSIKTGSLGYSF
jgi:WD40 repeat protein